MPKFIIYIQEEFGRYIVLMREINSFETTELSDHFRTLAQAKKVYVDSIFNIHKTNQYKPAIIGNLQTTFECKNMPVWSNIWVK